MTVKLISITPDAEKTMAYVARVSNPANQENDNYAGLLKYCIKHNHWSVFEQSFMTLEIETNRGIAAQILRHRSFTYQEFSQRYADTSLLTDHIPIPDLRRQDTKNRQNSIDDIPAYTKLKLQGEIAEYFAAANTLYKRLLDAGVAKESARFVLPLATPTRIYMSGSCRSWITYIALREKSGTQKEHMDIAKACKAVFAEQFPICYEALGGESDWEI
jgi:thymidylate synthase (FAD)